MEKTPQIRAAPSGAVCSAVLAMLLAVLLLPERSLFTVDTWWHLALGDQILAQRSIPNETFSFTAHGQPIFCHWWLSDVIFSSIVQLGGLNGLEAFGFVLVALICFSVGRLARSLRSSWFFVLAAELVFFLTAQRFLILRPQLFTALCAVWVFILYVRYRDGVSSRFLFVPLIFVVWANLHGGFLLGLVMLSSFLFVETVEAVLEGSGFSRARTVGGILLLSAVASLFNPYGPAAFYNALQHDPFVQGANRHIDEWLAPAFTNSPLLFICILVAPLIVATRRAKPSVLESCVFLGTLSVALLSWRHVILFGLFGVPILAAWVSRVIGRDEMNCECSSKRIFAVAGWVVFAATLWWQVFLRANVLTSPNLAKNFPIRAAQWLSEHPQQGYMFNFYDWGGYLVFALRGNPPVYIDSRLAPFLEIFPSEYFKILNLEDGWKEVLERRKISWMVLKTSSPLREKLEANEGWQSLYRDETATLLRSPQG